MSRLPIWDDELRREMADGRVMSHGQLLQLGLSKSSISRLVDRRVLHKEVHGMYVLAEYAMMDRLSLLAAKFGGTPEKPLGAFCLQVATMVHELTDMGLHNIELPEVALLGGRSNSLPSDLPAKIVQWGHPYSESDIEWHVFGQHGIYVTTPVRTVCDLYCPYIGSLPEGMASEALGRLMVRDKGSAERAVARAVEMRWGGRITRDYEAMRNLRRYSDADDSAVSDMEAKGITL